MNSSRDSFTLIELLIVIAILSVLGVTVVFILRPAEILSQLRDTRRLSDLQSINKALNWLSVDRRTVFFGTSSIVYVSIPDTSPNCDNLGLPPLPSGWSYACAPTSTYLKTDGTGWIPVNFTLYSAGSPLSRLPVDPINTASTGQYYTYVTGGSWELNAFLESNKHKSKARDDDGDSDNSYELGTRRNLAPLVFPHNWIKVPGSSTYETLDFWVMKYEAKYSTAGGGSGDDASDLGCQADEGDGFNWQICGHQYNNVISSPYGSPIVNISQIHARDVCNALGGRLITNSEWMTIVRNAEQVSLNWSDGSIGSCFFQGNIGHEEEFGCGYDGADPEKGINRNTKAKLILSNNEEIWDIAGNVSEYVMKDEQNNSIFRLPSDRRGAGWRWIDHTEIEDYGELSYDEIRPSDSSWNAVNGMGRIYTFNDYTSERVLIRGGYWHDGRDNAGAFAMDLSLDPWHYESKTGFRCARPN